jgi:exosortase
MERRTIFRDIGYNAAGAILYFVFIGTFLITVLHGTALDSTSLISLSIFLFSACCIVAFLFSYGSEAFRLASFPLFFLLLMTPWPDAMRNRVIVFLQHGSALATDWFFSIANIPFSREDVVITLPSVTIEIAQECSGIRSTLILFLAAVVLAHLFLRSGWSKVALIVFLIPVTIARNGLRIFVLSTLGMYVDESFLTGRLHHNGGIVFFILAFIVLWAMIWVLQKFEDKIMGRTIQGTPQNVAVSES